MSARVLLFTLFVLLLAGRCATPSTQPSVSGVLDPMSGVTPEDARALDKKREQRREMAKLLLEQAEQRSKTQQPNMWRPMDSSGQNDSARSPLEPIQILLEPWTILQKAIVPSPSPASATATQSLQEKLLK